ncbi:hypothetical protein BDV97DRAFT_22526 [Delphinella strobiligena]|nr:hypothetical protein BDV97DRAFT_22526 [Delphinella strobiligena]
MPARDEMIQAYRLLYRHCLRAVQYSKPARYIARDRLRHAFRSNSPSAFDPASVQKTLEFLDGAARVKGLEHRIVKNILHVWLKRSRKVKLTRNEVEQQTLELQAHAYHSFDHTIEMLNKTMGTCIS